MSFEDGSTPMITSIGRWVIALVMLTLAEFVSAAPATAKAKASSAKAPVPTPGAQSLGAVRPSNLVLPQFAVSSFSGATEVAQIVANDLALADVAAAANSSPAVEQARQQDARSGTVDLDAWTAAGVHYVLRGELSGNRATAELYDVASRRRLLGNSYSGIRSGEERRLAHQIADDVITALTNRTGMFSSYICALVERHGTKELVIMEPDGGNLRQLTREEALMATPAWGKNGAVIYVTSYRDNNPDLIGVTLRGQRFEVSRRPGLNTSPSWCEAIQRLAVTLSKDGNCEIYTMSADGRDLVRLTDNSDADTAPAWSPDGSRIAFTSDRSGTPQIYVMGADGSEPTRISTGRYCDSPAWSPDGSKIAYVVREGGEFNIRVREIGTGQEVQLTHGQGANRDPSWAPDSRHLVFVSDRAGSNDLYLIDIQVKVAHRIAEGNFSEPAWGPLFQR